MAIRHEISNCLNKNHLVGVYDIIEWIPTEWGGPNKPGEYLTADGKGNTQMLFTVGDTNRMAELIFGKGECPFEAILWDNHTKLTDSEIVRICFSGFDIWYTFEPMYDSYGEYDGTSLIIFRKESAPKYWLNEGRITGPIDDNLNKLPVHHTDNSRLVWLNENLSRYDENGHDTYDDIPLS
jgi:hypothetical protein